VISKLPVAKTVRFVNWMWAWCHQNRFGALAIRRIRRAAVTYGVGLAAV